METNVELAKLAIPLPERVRSRAQQRAAFPDMRPVKACCARDRARSGINDIALAAVENAAWIVLAICSLLVLIFSL